MSAPAWPASPPARLLDLAVEVPAGLWIPQRASDGALLLWAGLEPVAQVYSADIGKYVACCSPAVLLGLGV